MRASHANLLPFARFARAKKPGGGVPINWGQNGWGGGGNWPNISPPPPRPCMACSNSYLLAMKSLTHCYPSNCYLSYFIGCCHVYKNKQYYIEHDVYLYRMNSFWYTFTMGLIMWSLVLVN
jgi:hypothetical protein